MTKKIFLVSRCAWTLQNFRSGLMSLLKGHGYTVVGGGAGGDGFEPEVEALGVPFVRLPVDKKGINPLADFKLLWCLYRWYRKERPDIVHHFTAKPVIYGSMAARLAGVPGIINTVTGLGYVFTGGGRTLLGCLVTWMYRVSLGSAHLTFFQNEDDLDFFLARSMVNPAKTMTIAGSGVNCRYFSPSSAAETEEHRPLAFLMVSRLLRDKGIYEFVEAARLVKERFPEIRFLLLGRRDTRNPTVVPESDLARWQSEGVVSWLGEVRDVRPVLADADVVVLPSYYREGVPRSLLEAAAMEKPIITTDSTGCREAVDAGETGLLVPVRNAGALAGAMSWMIEHPGERVQMGKAGRLKVKKDFDERTVLKRITDVYEQVGG